MSTNIAFPKIRYYHNILLQGYNDSRTMAKSYTKVLKLQKHWFMSQMAFK